MPTREICAACGRINPVGFHVPDEVWQAMMGEKNDNLCVLCFAQRADDAGIEWDAQIEFSPVSLISHLAGLREESDENEDADADYEFDDDDSS